MVGIFKKQQDIEYFWSLVITKSWVEAGIWRVVDEKAEVVAEGGASSWQEDKEETLVSASDSSLSAAAASLEGEAQEPSKVVFGLPASWIEEGSIVPQKLEFLKTLSKELELKPAGFVIIPEAITHFLKAREGTAISAILLGLSEDTIDLTLIQNGKMLGITEVARSISLAQDVAEGLARLSSLTQYPSRLLLYNHRVENLDDARQNLISANWDELQVKFLHTPKIEILPADIGVAAVSLAGGAEVGQAKTIVLPEKEEEDSFTEEDVVTLKEENEDNVKEVSVEELGFLKDADIAGFDLPKSDFSSYGKDEAKFEESEINEVVEEKEPVSQSQPLISSAHVSEKPKFPLSIKAFKLPIPSLSLPGGGFRLFAILGVFLLMLFGGGIAYWYLPKAEVTIFVAPKVLEKSIELEISPSATSVDAAGKALPARSVDIPVSGDKTGSASGTKTVGDKSKGKVVVVNTGGSTTLKKGTALSGPNGLKFTLDDDVSVASGSSSVNPSKTTTMATASDIGAEYNLASGAEFAVGNFSKSGISATNEESFSGGTSREVSAVSKGDMDSLETGLISELAQQGIQSLRSSLSDGEILIEESVSLTPKKKEFSHKQGEEATTLKLTVEGTINALVVPRDILNALVRADLESDIPSGFILRDDQLNISYRKKEVEAKKTTTSTKNSTNVKQTEETTNSLPIFIAEVNAHLLPQVNPDEIVKSIVGKYPPVAKEYLATIPGFTRAEISLNVKLPGMLSTLPRISKNIVVEVMAER